MSDPRMISADEAKNIQALFSSFGDLSNRELKIRDLAATVVAQAAQIERVREELKELRDYYIDREARSRERLESATDEREQSQFARFAHSHRRTHEALTRILEAAADHAEKAAAHVDETLGDADD